MELRHLRYFLAVAEEGHITRAAQRLGIQQPPLSQQIRALETELGVALFDRTPRGVTLTAAGHSLLRDTREVLASVDRASASAKLVARGGIGRLAIGFTTSAILHPAVPRIIRAFRDQYAGVELELAEESAATLTQALLGAEMQAALLREPVSRPPEISFLELSQEELLVALPAGHRLLGQSFRAGVPLAELAGERLILVRRPGAAGIYENVIQACRRIGVEPLIAAEVPRMLSTVNLVAAGVGISFVPASMRKVGLQLVGYRRLLADPPLTAPLTLGWRTGNNDPVLANFVAVTRKAAA